MSIVSEWRNNLTIGLYLANRPFGAATSMDILINALGYDTRYPQSLNTYLTRLRKAEQLGEQRYAARIPGYFTIKAQPFGNMFLYRSVWYTLVNPTSGTPQAVLISEADVSSMRRFNEQYVATRSRTTRNVRAADQVLRYRAALNARDVDGAYTIEGEMAIDGTLGELLTSQLGIPYAEIGPVLAQLADGSRIGIQFSFITRARKIMRLQRELQQEHTSIARELSTWINITAGLPSNARQLALADAQRRLASMR